MQSRAAGLAGWAFGTCKPNALGNTTVQSASDISYLDPRYTPPEYLQKSDQPIGRWPIKLEAYLLFELVTGRVPFVGRNVREPIAKSQCNNAVPRLSLYSNNAPLALQRSLSTITLTKEEAPQERLQRCAGMILCPPDAMQQPTFP